MTFSAIIVVLIGHLAMLLHKIRGFIMKKNKLLIALLSLSFVTATVFALGGVAVSADDDDRIDSGVCGANLIWSLDTDYKLTISGSGAMTNFDDMGSPWLIYGEDITEIDIGEDVTTIGDYAFQDCSNLTTITIPEGITYIGEEAFLGCPYVTDVWCYADIDTLIWKDTYRDDFKGDGSTVLHVHSDDFPWNLYNKVNVTIVVDIGIVSGTCGDNLTWFLDDTDYLHISGTGAMYNYSYGTAPWYDYRDSITAIGMDSGVTSVGDYAFAGISALEWFNLSDSVKNIGNGAFKDCTGITQVYSPSGLLTIGDSAFEGCTGINEVNITNSLTSIGEKAFKNCSNITSSIVIPRNVTYIGEDAFYGCTQVYKVICNADPRNILWCDTEHDDFKEDGSVICDVSYFYYEDFVSTLSHVNVTFAQGTLEEGSCGDNVSWQYDGAGQLHISGTGAMYDLGSFNDATYSRFRYDITEVVIEDGVTYIGNNSFNGCKNLNSLVIPESVDSIGDKAFSGCEGLTGLVIRGSVKSIGDSAFANCKFTSLVISDGVQHIGNSAFENCEKLKTVSMANTVETLGTDAFSFCLELETITLSNKLTKIEECTFYGCFALKTVTLPSGIKEIGSSAFNSSGITSIDLPSGLETIGAYAFSYSEDLESITIPGDVTTVGEYAFSWCTDLKTVFIPNSEKELELGEYVFFESGIQSIVIPGCVKIIPYSAFELCTNLVNVIIMHGVTEIETYAFAGCKNLTTVTIPASMEYISSDSFRGCTNVSDVYCYAEPNRDFDWYDGDHDDFKTGFEKTICHVYPGVYYYEKYVSRFDDDESGVNVVFAGDLTDSIGEQLEGYSLSLEGDIGVNFYMRASTILTSSSTSKVVFTITNPEDGTTRTQEVYVNPQDDPNLPYAVFEDDYYIFKCKVAAKEMTAIITAQMTDGDRRGNSYTYSVQQYAKYILEHPDLYPDEQDLVKAMLNYGTWAQEYFGYNTDNFASDIMPYRYDTYIRGVRSFINDYQFNGNTYIGDTGIRLKSANLELESELVMNICFDGTIPSGAVFKYGDEVLRTRKVNGFTMVSIKGITASQIDNDFTITLYDRNGNSLGSVTYSPYNYFYNVITRPETETRTYELKMTIQALIWYNRTAKDYAAK